MDKNVEEHQLLEDRVLVKPDENQNMSDGFVVEKESQKKAVSGTVLLAGPGFVAKDTGVRIDMTVKEGDSVRYPSYAGAPYEGYLLLRETDIISII